MPPHQPGSNVSGVAAPGCRCARTRAPSDGGPRAASRCERSAQGLAAASMHRRADIRTEVRRRVAPEQLADCPGRHARRRSEPASSRAEAASARVAAGPVKTSERHGRRAGPAPRSLTSRGPRRVKPKGGPGLPRECAPHHAGPSIGWGLTRLAREPLVGRLPRDPEHVADRRPGAPLSPSSGHRKLDVGHRAIATSDRELKSVEARTLRSIEALDLPHEGVHLVRIP